jgi:hypothetical protein
MAISDLKYFLQIARLREWSSKKRVLVGQEVADSENRGLG